MARRGLSGQLNMFDFFQNGENGEVGEVEMVSLMPSFEEEVPKEKPRKVSKKLETDKEPVVMSRTYRIDGETIQVSYLNYNKVCVRKGAEEPMIHYFENSKDAVDFYVQYMQEMEHEG